MVLLSWVWATFSGRCLGESITTTTNIRQRSRQIQPGDVVISSARRFVPGSASNDIVFYRHIYKQSVHLISIVCYVLVCLHSVLMSSSCDVHHTQPATTHFRLMCKYPQSTLNSNGVQTVYIYGLEMLFCQRKTTTTQNVWHICLQFYRLVIHRIYV